MLLSVVALGAAAGCSSYDLHYSSTPNPNPPAAAVAPSTAVGRLGTGVVQSVALVPAAPPSERASASAGGSIPTHAAYRLSIRMDDGSVQTIDQDSRDFQVGDRVRVTGSGRVIRY